VERRRVGWRSRRRWALVGAGALAILVLFMATRPSPAPQQQLPADTRVFTVGGLPTLVFAHDIGSVHITNGADGQVHIQEVRNGITDAITIHYAQRGDVITVTADVSTGLYLDTWVDFNVSVPRAAGLNASVVTGTLTVSGLRGPIALKDSDGSIWVSQLDGSTSLTTQSGSVNADHVNGQLVVTTGNGTVTTTATHLSGRCLVQAQSGTINFHGSLDRHGSFEFRNTNGAVGLTLPSVSAFQLDASSAGGSINSDFAGVRAVTVNSGTGAHGTVGAAPRPMLRIVTTSGSIDLHKGE
jgi:hypothetical protein